MSIRAGALRAALGATLALFASGQPLPAGSLVVYRLGAVGAPTAPASGIQNPIFLDAFSPSAATASASATATTPLGTVALPSSGAGLCTGQSSSTEGELTGDLQGDAIYVACYPLVSHSH